VRGCVEFGLRVLPVDTGPHLDASSGAEYMRTRLEELRGQDRLVAELHEPLARLARESTLQRDDGGIRAAYLVERRNAASFREAAESLERATELAAVCTGPWPPYSFAEGDS
jgi:hypothetical protein